MAAGRRQPDSPAPPPYVAATEAPAEFTVRAVLLGMLLSAAFGMVNAYLALKVGITASASIPAAVLSMAALRGVLGRGTILENNVVQTTASSGDSLAAGIAFTVPALIFLGYDPSGFRIFLLAATAGLLGIVMLIPLRHELTIAEHARLPFPEGTACATVLIAGDRGRAAARPVFVGIALGALYQFVSRGLQLWNQALFVSVASLHKLSFGAELTPLFLGVGYLVGARIAAIMLAGGLLAWMVLIPLFDSIAGTAAGTILGLPADLATHGAQQIWSAQVRFVGAGAVACGGVWSIARAAPVMWRALSSLLAAAGAREPADVPRTERDLSPAVVIGATAALGLAMWLIPAYEMRWPEVALALVFSFFFVVVSGQIVGLIGTTSQPISGMTITALLVTAAVLRALGYDGRGGTAATLAVAAVVCTAAALAGDTIQDFKCGALVGATPRALELAQMIGVAVAALRAGWLLALLHAAYTLGSADLPAPQAKLMATLADGVMHGQLPWALLALGVGLAALAELAGIASLPFAIGLYLPITSTASLIFGGLIAAHWGRGHRDDDPATLFASGLIAGDALLGVVFAGLIVAGWGGALALRTPAEGGWLEAAITIIPFALLAWALIRHAGRGAAA
ncbi:MAG TPA: oligopeptide transporter, OPT family [Candidatus Dormibacteraeota bacterium]|nr:oligopeptide transporter, OPT family [Candidatus Dormibacteraeota bacterium]